MYQRETIKQQWYTGIQEKLVQEAARLLSRVLLYPCLPLTLTVSFDFSNFRGATICFKTEYNNHKPCSNPKWKPHTLSLWRHNTTPTPSKSMWETTWPEANSRTKARMDKINTEYAATTCTWRILPNGEQSPVIPLNTKHRIQTPTVSSYNPQRTRKHGIISQTDRPQRTHVIRNLLMKQWRAVLKLRPKEM